MSGDYPKQIWWWEHNAAAATEEALLHSENMLSY